HPQTSGYPTLDYFLSSALMEPPDGDAYYTERLVRLPNLSIYYELLTPRPAPTTRAALGLRPEAVAFWSGQMLLKYLPQYDAVFPRIALGAPVCLFVFSELAASRITELFRERLRRTFAGFGLDADRFCVILPRLDWARFVGAIGQCDVLLD